MPFYCNRCSNATNAATGITDAENCTVAVNLPDTITRVPTTARGNIAILRYEIITFNIRKVKLLSEISQNENAFIVSLTETHLIEAIKEDEIQSPSSKNFFF